jgi:acyl-coenzyme A synthetase/AMP-(fatty) acid ligase/3-hydroxymyristoyl/3-hydroxydecanoyl-(acyl carrier protein) dehydratase
VAFGALGTRTLEDFGCQTAALAGQLRGGGTRYLVQCEDTYTFAVTMAALAVSGSVGVLAPNAQRGTLEELSAGTANVIATGAANVADGIDPLALEPAAPRARYDLQSPDTERPLFEMFTSGSSGAPTRVEKALGHLESEVRALERSFHDAVESTNVLATVSPQHLYGLLFRVLWPLATGRPFQRETLLRPEELSKQIAATDRAMLVGTPTHLRVLAASPALAAAAPKLKSIFSSGGPLPYETAVAIEQATGIAPVELFGSTETGGVAYRTRRKPDTPWVLLDGVDIEIEADGPSGERSESGRLIVSSPFVSAGRINDSGTCKRFVTGDRVVRIADESMLTFQLAGRVDRDVQIAEKRIALPELEQRVLLHPLVEEVAAASFQQQTTTRLGVIVVLSREGRLALAERGRARLRAELIGTLAPFYDRVVLPRRLRFVHALPRDSQGKTSAAAASDCLSDRLADATREAVLLEDRSRPGLIERRYVVPNDLVYLQGHFEGFPLVAGVVQVKWALEAAAELFDEMQSAPDLRSVKFRQVLRPLEDFTLRVQLDRAAGRADFAIANDDHEFSSGRFMVVET